MGDEYKIIKKKTSLFFGESPSQASQAEKGKGEKKNRWETKMEKHMGLSKRKKKTCEVTEARKSMRGKR